MMISLFPSLRAILLEISSLRVDLFYLLRRDDAGGFSNAPKLSEKCRLTSIATAHVFAYYRASLFGILGTVAVSKLPGRQID